MSMKLSSSSVRAVTGTDSLMYSRHSRVISLWLTQEEGKSFTQCLQSVVEKISSLDDPLHALRIVEVLGWAINHAFTKRHYPQYYDVPGMVQDEWAREMEC